LKIVADPSRPKNRLIRPLADFGGSAVQSPSAPSQESLKSLKFQAVLSGPQVANRLYMVGLDIVFTHKDRDSDSSRSKRPGCSFSPALGRVFPAFPLLKPDYFTAQAEGMKAGVFISSASYEDKQHRRVHTCTAQV
jgi:hypothetical protein